MPKSEKQGRRHSSFVNVSLKKFGEKSRADVSQVVEEFTNFGGKGGQHRNRSMSDVRLVDHRTGIKVQATGRSQYRNRQDAWSRMRKLLEDQETVQIDKATDEASFVWVGWRDEVKCARTGKKISMSKALKNGLSKVV